MYVPVEFSILLFAHIAYQNFVSEPTTASKYKGNNQVALDNIVEEPPHLGLGNVSYCVICHLMRKKSKNYF